MIGTGGAHVRFLAEQSGARVRLNSKEEAVLTQERIMTIVGAAEDCVKCVTLVLAKLLEDATVGSYQNMSASYSRSISLLTLSQSMGGMNLGGVTAGQTAHAEGSEMLSQSTVIQMSIPDNLIGNILGKKGNTIAEIQSLSGAKVTVSNRCVSMRTCLASNGDGASYCCWQRRFCPGN